MTSRIDDDARILEAATEGEWAYGCYKKGEPRTGSLVAATAPGQQILAVNGGGTTPHNDGIFIANAHNRDHLYHALARAVREYLASVPGVDADEKLRAALASLEAPDEPKGGRQ